MTKLSVKPNPDLKVEMLMAVMPGMAVHKQFHKAVETYEKAHNAKRKYLFVNANYKHSTLDPLIDRNLIRENDYTFSKKARVVVTKDMRAETSDPTNGFDFLVGEEEVLVVGSPKQRWKELASFPDEFGNRETRGILGTGSICVPNYKANRRTARVAKAQHIVGALILIYNRKTRTTHYRHVIARKDGSFTDLDKRYYPDGRIEKVKGASLVLGDLHFIMLDPKVHAAHQAIAKLIEPDYIIGHDVDDFRSKNHHNEGKRITKARLARGGMLDMKKEDGVNRHYLLEYQKLAKKKLKVIKSNHDEARDRWLEEARWIDEPYEFLDGAILSAISVLGGDTLQFSMTGVEEFTEFLETVVEKMNNHDYSPTEFKPSKHFTKTDWGDRNTLGKIAGVYTGKHGDKGANGSKGSSSQFVKMVKKMVKGHTHTTDVLHKIYTVGTSARTQMGYNDGEGTTWSQSLSIVYPDGEVQMVQLTNGQWT